MIRRHFLDRSAILETTASSTRVMSVCVCVYMKERPGRAVKLTTQPGNQRGWGMGQQLQQTAEQHTHSYTHTLGSPRPFLAVTVTTHMVKALHTEAPGWAC